MKVEKVIRKSHFYNEDRFVVGDNFCMVIDGATALQKTNLFKPTEASWFVSFVKERLKGKTVGVYEKLCEISKQAFYKFNDTLSKNKFNLENLSYYPSAGISFAEIKNDKVDIYTIGDCEAVIKLKSGKVIRLIQPQLPELDKTALEKIIDLKNKKRFKMKDAIRECSDILLENRKLMNTPDGYSVYAPSLTGEFNFLKETFNLSEIEEIYLYTDGIAQAFDELKIYSNCEEMFSKSLDIRKEVEKIVKQANLDKECEKYPRFKVIDDITIIKITF